MNYEKQWKYGAMYQVRSFAPVFYQGVVDATMECITDFDKGGYSADEKNCIRNRFAKRMDAQESVNTMYKVLRASENREIIRSLLDWEPYLNSIILNGFYLPSLLLRRS